MLQNPPPVSLHAGMVITRSANIRPGLYRLHSGGEALLQVSGSGMSLHFKGVRLQGDGKSIGMYIHDASNITISGLNVSGCTWGIVLKRCSRVHLLYCTSSRNANLPAGTVIDESGRLPQSDHGGGILLQSCQHCTVEYSSAQREWDGIDLVNSSRCSITRSNFSYNSNWGLHLWNSSHNLFAHNRAVWCTTGAGSLYQGLGGWQTYDAEAVCIEHNSNRNTIAYNDLRFGGDGIFIRANEGPQMPGKPVPPLNSSDGSQLLYNNCAFSPNNAIEVDLVANTVIAGNNCSLSNYGMWLGYSRHSRVTGNLCIQDTTRAIEIENGQDGLFTRNLFGYDASHAADPLVLLRQNGRDATPSGPYRFYNNLFYGAQTCLQLIKTGKTTFQHNIALAAAQPEWIKAVSASQYLLQKNRFEKMHSVHISTHSLALRAGGRIALPSADFFSGLPHLVEINHIPLMPGSASGQYLLPADALQGLQPAHAQVRELAASGWRAALQCTLLWPAGARIEQVTPAGVLTRGASVTLTGAGLAQGVLLLNGKPAVLLRQADTLLQFLYPAHGLQGGCSVEFEPAHGKPLPPLLLKAAP